MAEQDLPAGNADVTEKDKPSFTRFWDNDSANVPTTYVNRWTVDDGISDVFVLFGTFFNEYRSESRRCIGRLVFTHSNFLAFADLVQKEAQFLRQLYDGSDPSIEGVSEETYSKVAQDVFGDSDSEA